VRRSRPSLAALAPLCIAAALALAACGGTVSKPPPAQQAEPVPAEPAPAVAQPVEPVAPEPVAPEPLPLPPGPIPIALLVPLSGTQAELGQALLDAATMALFDLGGTDLVLAPYDTAGAGGAAAAAQAAVAGGARLVLGPVFAADVAAAGPVVNAAGVQVIAFSSDKRAARPGVYLLGWLPEQQVDRVVGFAAAHGLTRFAALVPETDFGYAMAAALARRTGELGVGLVQPGFYPPGDLDATDAVRRFANYESRASALEAQLAALEGQTDEVSVKARERLAQLTTVGDIGYDAVLLPEAGPRLRTVAALLPYFDVALPEVRLLGTAAWNEPATLSEPSLAGAWFAAPAPETRGRFLARFEQTFGRPAPTIASLAYDAVALAGVLARAPAGADFSAARLTQPSGFVGVDGIFRFRPDGTAERGLAVFEVSNQAAVLVEPAPTTFELLTQ